MSDPKKVKIYTLRQEFPCGPKSSCCGPTGQSVQDVMALKGAIQKLGVDVEVYDMKKIENFKDYPQVLNIFRTFGPRAVPVITVAEEVACMGQSGIDEIVSAIKSKL